MKRRVLEIKTGEKALALNPAEIKMELERLSERISSLRRCL